MRRTFEVSMPRDLSLDQVLAFVRSLAGLPHPKPWQPAYGISFELYADEQGKRYFISLPGHIETEVDNWLTHFIDGASLELIETDVVMNTAWTAFELGLTSTRRPLDIKSPRNLASGISACFSTFQAGEAAVMQWLVTPSRPYQPTAEVKEKLSDKTFDAVVRLGAVGEHPDQLLRRVYAGLSVAHGFGVKFKKRLVRDAAGKLRRRTWVPCPVFLNATELAGLLGWPFGEFSARIRARVLAPDNMIDRTGIVLGTSNFPKLRGRPLALPHSSLTVHAWICGPSGSGKSVLMHNIAAQAISAGLGLVLIEPKGDLARDVLASVPRERVGDVIWFDPTDTRPIGINVLAGHDPERITGHIVGMFKNLYGDSWGSRLERILRYAVLTAAQSGLTLYDVKQLLLNKDYRARVVGAIRDPEVRQFWRWLDEASDTYIDSVIHKLDTFLGSGGIRRIVGQRTGLDLAEVVRERKILLVPLPTAALGEANAAMLGSLVREMVWDEVRRRPPEQREPSILMLDEFQNYADLSTTKSDPFAEARSYGLSLIIANQHTAQLPKAVLASVRANTATKVVFALDSDDAKKLKDSFTPLSPEDLRALPRYGVAMSIMSSTGRAPTVTGVTAPPPHPTGAGPAALAASRARWGRPVSEVEAELSERHRAGEERRRPDIGRVT